MPQQMGSPMISSTRTPPSNFKWLASTAISPEVAQCHGFRAPQCIGWTQCHGDWVAQCRPPTPEIVDFAVRNLGNPPMPHESVNDRASLPNDAKTGLLNDFSEIASQTIQHLKPQPPSGNVVSSTPAITTRNEGSGPINGTPPARQRNEVGRPMFSLFYDMPRPIPQRRTSAQLAMRHASTASRHPAFNRQCIQSVVGGFGIT
ncbi:uncharacterized protein SCHCODRAFT_02736885 [Schizophyllum commune H4-8]|uniref:Uncharacterized protein n=1 Tax=Schizophyllum commune (strain H4-8 / FGSC 9210) TaxID=578458 RepID=D8QA50_SCHCM|nr:uncharacterized protein SCHCODRAFT_02736885 [Schizophyllum commune H4-8]KAI5890146.1 hypothetical protein SCHCODRAFT_02736885 [Schizophyllum commune H4-8]